jgi:hypothetical protein
MGLLVDGVKAIVGAAPIVFGPRTLGEGTRPISFGDFPWAAFPMSGSVGLVLRPISISERKRAEPEWLFRLLAYVR